MLLINEWHCMSLEFNFKITLLKDPKKGEKEKNWVHKKFSFDSNGFFCRVQNSSPTNTFLSPKKSFELSSSFSHHSNYIEI